MLQKSGYPADRIDEMTFLHGIRDSVTVPANAVHTTVVFVLGQKKHVPLAILLSRNI